MIFRQNERMQYLKLEQVERNWGHFPNKRLSKPLKLTNFVCQKYVFAIVIVTNQVNILQNTSFLMRYFGTKTGITVILGVFKSFELVSI